MDKTTLAPMPAPTDPSLPTSLPNWLAPSPMDETDVDPDNPDGTLPSPVPLEVPRSKEHIRALRVAREARLSLLHDQFEAHFDTVLDVVASGSPASAAFEATHMSDAMGKFFRWVKADPARFDKLREAQEIGAEVVSNQMVAIADASDSLEDVARSTLRINTRKWLLGVWDRKRFGEVKQNDVNITVNLADAIAAGQARVDAARTIDAETRVIHGDN